MKSEDHPKVKASNNSEDICTHYILIEIVPIFSPFNPNSFKTLSSSLQANKEKGKYYYYSCDYHFCRQHLIVIVVLLFAQVCGGAD